MDVRHVIVDLEATCWRRGTRPGRQEIIEIGAVLLTSLAAPPADEFVAFVRPIARPELSELCKQLTTIRQEDVDQAEPFHVVFPRFVAWIGSEPFRLCSWGAYDLKQFRTDCRRHRMPLPDSFASHINLKRLFAEQRGLRPGGMREALRRLSLPLDGTHHRALDDARNIAKIARVVLAPDSDLEASAMGVSRS